jgi:hypothetical protein
VSSGMAGALIINGNRKPELTPSGALLPGDIDTLLVTTEQGSTSVPFPERVLLSSRFNMPAETITAQSGALIRPIRKRPGPAILPRRTRSQSAV